MMSKSRFINTSQILEGKLDLIDKIRGDVLYRTSIYLINLKIPFENTILHFIRNPKHYPGQIHNIFLIIQKFLDDVISENYTEIQAHDLTIKFVSKIIMRQLFKRGGTH